MTLPAFGHSARIAATGHPRRTSLIAEGNAHTFIVRRHLRAFKYGTKSKARTLLEGMVTQVIWQMGAPMTGPDQLSRSIDDRLAEIIHQVADTRDVFANAAQHLSRTVNVRLEQARAREGARNVQFQKERERVNSKVKRALANARQKVQRWKETGQSEKLRRYADQSEQYALAALQNANEAVDTALIAAMESLEARLISDDVTRKPRS